MAKGIQKEVKGIAEGQIVWKGRFFEGIRFLFRLSTIFWKYIVSLTDKEKLTFINKIYFIHETTNHDIYCPSFC